MIAAIESVRGGGKSIRDAAVEFNMPKSTLGDGIKGQIVDGTRNGPETLLSKEDEERLAAYLIDVSKKGYGKSKEIIIFMATQMAVKRGKEVKGEY